MRDSASGPPPGDAERAPHDPLSAEDPRQIGPYQILGRLGGGGMGHVYLGRSRGGRAVAVKLIRTEYADREDFRKRFAREVAAARRVGGHYTAQVVEAQPDARPLPWMATTYIPGPSLRETVRRFGRLAPEVVESLAAGLAEGLEAIHAAGLVHRDLKPENVILATNGPCIIDFGIARAIDDSVMTATGVVMGTYPFMAPEQAYGRPVGMPADIFSLGSVLYFAATGRYPFGTGPEVAERIAHGQPDLSDVPKGLRELLGMCFKINPAERASAAEILTALSRRTGESRSPQPFAETIDPHPAEASAAPNMNVSGQGSSWVPRWEPPPGFDIRRQPTRNPDVRRRTVLLGLGTAAVGAAAVATGIIVDKLVNPPERPRQPAPPADRNVLTGHTGTVTALAFVPDGSTLVSAGADGTLRLWDLTARRATAVLRGHAGAVKSIAFSPDRRTLATGGADKTVRLWDLATRKTGAVLGGHGGAVNCLAFAPDGGILASGGADHDTFLWNMATHTPITPLSDRRAEVTAVLFGTDGTVLITAYAEGKMRFWDTTTHEKRGLLTAHGATSINSMAITPDGRLAFGESPASVGLWDAAKDRSIDPPLHTSGPVNTVAFHPDGKRLAVGTRAGVLLIWDTSTNRNVGTPLGGHNGAVTSVKFSPDGRLLASAGTDRTVRLWTVT